MKVWQVPIFVTGVKLARKFLIIMGHCQGKPATVISWSPKK